MSEILYLRQNYHFGPRKIADYLKRFHGVSVAVRDSASDSAEARDESTAGQSEVSAACEALVVAEFVIALLRLVERLSRNAEVPTGSTNAPGNDTRSRSLDGDTWMTNEGFVSPERMTAAILPGWPD